MIILRICLFDLFDLLCGRITIVAKMSEPPVTSSHQPWSTTSLTYSSNVGRTSAFAAARLLQLAHGLSPVSSDSYVLDDGAGTGAITSAVAAQFPSTPVLATDISASMLANISSQHLPNVATRVLDARLLSESLEKESFSHVFNTFMLQTITTPLAAVRQMYTVLMPGGVVGIALWARPNGPFEIWERACQSIDPTYKLPTAFDDPNAWRTQDELEASLGEVGFHDIVSEEVKMPFEFESAAKFVDFWFGAKNPAAVQAMSNWHGDVNRAKSAVATVVDDQYAGGKEIYTWAVLGTAKK